jgi:hypothetical protein
MKYADVMGSGAIASFIKTGSGIQKLIRRGGGQLHRQHGDPISLLLFFQNKKSRLKTRTQRFGRCICSRPQVVGAYSVESVRKNWSSHWD